MVVLGKRSPVVVSLEGVGRAASRPGTRVPVVACLIYLGYRVLTLGEAAWLLRRGEMRTMHWSLWQWMTHVFDARFYERIASHGYAGHPYGWFPGYPAAMRAVAVLPWVSVAVAGLLVTLAAGLAAAWGVARLGMMLTGNPKTSYLLVALWCAAPGSVVLSMVYSEALFIALAVWSLIALLNRNWLLAGGLAMLAGTVRSGAMALVAAIAIAALAVLVNTVRNREPLGPVWRPAAAPVLAALGLLGFWAYVALQTGHLTGWFWAESHWYHMGFDGGRGAYEALRSVFLGVARQRVMIAVPAIVAAVLLAGWAMLEDLPAVLKVYTAGIVFLAITGDAHYLGGTPRFLLPAVLLGYPLARVLTQVRASVLYPLLAFAGIASTWFSLYLMGGGWAP